MSGSSRESVMGYTTAATTDNSEITILYSNFFGNTAYTKYWDRYTSTSQTNFNNRILGDATGEMGPFFSEIDPNGKTNNKSSWYNDLASFTPSHRPWFSRGGVWSIGINAGIFNYYHSNGGSDAGSYSFRIVLTPNN